MKHIDYTKESDQTYWDELAESGNTYQHGHTKHRQKILDLIKKSNVKSILDVGCGTGPVYWLTKDIDVKYKGVDYSKGFISIAKRNFSEGDFEVQDARKLKEKDNSWDLVLLMHTLDHIDDWKAALREAKRVSSRLVMIILWRSFTMSEDWIHQTVMNDTLYKDTFLTEFRKRDIEGEFAKIGLKNLDRGEIINDDNKYNYYYTLLI